MTRGAGECAAGLSRARVQLSLRADLGHANCMARAARGTSPDSVCAGTSSMRSRRPRSRPASHASTISISGDNAGVSYFDVNQRGGLRVSSAKAFLQARAIARQSHGVDARARRKTASSSAMRRAPALHGRHAAARRGTRESARLARNHPCRRAPSARRNCCSSPASAPRHCCASTASKCCTTSPAWARICRIICRSARCSRCSGVRTLNVVAGELLGPLRHRT